MIIILSVIIVWHILRASATVNCYLLLTIVSKKMLLVSQPFIANLFENVNFLFLISYVVGKLIFSSILIKKHTVDIFSEQKLLVQSKS